MNFPQILSLHTRENRKVYKFPVIITLSPKESDLTNQRTDHLIPTKATYSFLEYGYQLINENSSRLFYFVSAETRQCLASTSFLIFYDLKNILG